MNVPASHARAQKPRDFRVSVRSILLRSFAMPAILLAFFSVAPSLLNWRLHDAYEASVRADATLGDVQKAVQIRAIDSVDFERVALASAADAPSFARNLFAATVPGQFERLRFAFWAALGLVLFLGALVGVTAALSRRARRSPGDLIANYRLAWKISISGALLKVFVLIPLLTYGVYEFTTLAFERILVQLTACIVLGGLWALWKSARILMRPVPLEFEERAARPVRPQEAPELWRAIGGAAERLATAPPENILLGLKNNFYVTELAVNFGAGRVSGRTLYLSLPLVKRLSEDEVLAIVGHELGHFIGEDTRMTREFYPLKLKAQATLRALAGSGMVGSTSAHTLVFFSWCFGTAEQATSRDRELKADQVAARLTSADAMGRALIRVNILSEALRIGVTGEGGLGLARPLDSPISAILPDRLIPNDAFWSQLYEAKTPHPLDSHPALRVRLEALGYPTDLAHAKALAVEETDTAFGHWLCGRDALFTALEQLAGSQASRLRERVGLVQATTQTEEGRKLLAAHFPEVRWSGRAISFWFPFVVLGGFSAFSGLAAATAGSLRTGVVLGTAAIAGTVFAGVFWRRHWRGRFVLTAESLSYTGWRRPLAFASVERVLTLRGYGSPALVFRLKRSEPTLWKAALLPFRSRMVRLALGRIDAKPAEVIATLSRYLQRQA